MLSTVNAISLVAHFIMVSMTINYRLAKLGSVQVIVVVET